MLCSSLLGLAALGCAAAPAGVRAQEAAPPAWPGCGASAACGCADDGEPTSFRVDNRLSVPLLDFRLQLTEDRWLPIGDLAPGISGFTALVPRSQRFGVFEFRFPAQRASGDYSLGSYQTEPDGSVRIELDPAAPLHAAPGYAAAPATFRFAAPAALRARAAAPGEAERFPLIEVPEPRTGFSTGMWCGDWSIGGGVLLCWTPFMHYYAPVFGVGAGLAWGALVSTLPAWRLLQVFPVQASHVGLPGLGLIEFSTVPADEQTPSLRVARFLGIGLAASLEHAALGGFTWPWLGAAPDGSYAASCQDLAYDPVRGELRARCLDGRGLLQTSSLDLDSCQGSGVINDQGALACDHPRGSYEHSCGPLRYRDGRLQAACTMADGHGLRATELDYLRDCEPGSEVSNIEGALRCDIRRFPPGPYRRVCSRIRFDDGVLRADCGAGPDIRTTEVVLDYARTCREGSAVDYAPRYAARGQLVCEQPR